MSSAAIESNLRISLRSDVTEAWFAKNPTLIDGEVGQDVTTGTFRMGPGRWNDLEEFIPKGKILELINAALSDHISNPTPHEAYDDGTSLLLLYLNAKV